jgi:hypothetical protein
MIDQKTKELINEMPYESMLRLWRFAPIGDQMFQDETGDYFRDVMLAKKAMMPNEKHVRASKNVGWQP